VGSLHAAILTTCLCGGGETVLMDFYGDHCPPCRAMQPVLQQLEARGYPIRKVNVQQEPRLASQYGVRGIPCFVMLVNGREVDRVVGATSSTRLEQMLALAGPGRSAVQQPALAVSAGASNSGSLPIPAEISKSTFAAGPSQTQSPGDTSAAAAGPSRPRTPSSTGPAQEKLEADLIACTARLRIEDATGNSCGSGTIIDARRNEALILTCGHLFRDSQGTGRIEVDLFGPYPAERIPGHLVHYDLQKDVGLIKIRVPGPVYVAQVAPPGYSIAKGARVINVGCNNGDAPTVRYAQVTALDKFLGPSNVEASGLPVQGRSGGGLFNADGQVIGVCNAAVPTDNEGLYAALASIHAELDQTELAFVYRGQEGKSGAGTPSPSPGASGSEQTAVAASTPRSPGAGAGVFTAEPTSTAGREALAAAPPSMPKRMPPPSNLLQLTDAPGPAAPLAPTKPPGMAAPGQASPLSAEEKAAWEKVQRSRADGAELICIIRSRTDPNARSEVLVLDRVSPAFLQQLTTEATQPTHASTSSGNLTRSKPWSTESEGQVSPSAESGTTLGHAIEATTSSATSTSDWQPRWLELGYQGS